jgi:hypothetical protein
MSIMSWLRMAPIVGVLVVLWPRTAWADVSAPSEDVPVEVLQRLLCEQEDAGDFCGEGALGEALVCARGPCTGGPCLLCVRTGAATGADRGLGPRTVRLGPDTRFDPEQDPRVGRGTWVAGTGLALALLALLGFALFPRRAMTRRVAGGAVAVGIGTLTLGLALREAAVKEYTARHEEEREVVLMPVRAQLQPTWQERAAWQHHIDHLKRLLDHKGRPWRQHAR